MWLAGVCSLGRSREWREMACLCGEASSCPVRVNKGVGANLPLIAATETELDGQVMLGKKL